MMSKEYFTAKELADFKLREFPKTPQNIIAKAKRENWQSRKHDGRGGGKEYHISSLPEAARLELIKKLLPEVEKPTSVQKQTIDANNMTDKQRECMYARGVIVDHVKTLSQTLGIGIMAAEKAFSDASKLGSLDDSILDYLLKANQHTPKGGAVSAATLRLWRSLKAKGFEHLAPKERDVKIPEYPWAKEFLKRWRTPQKPSIAQVYEIMLIGGFSLPSRATVARYINNLPEVERNRGRMGSRELKSLKVFNRRDTSSLLPCDAYTADGHRMDLEVINPETGRPFRPEMVSILDVATRRLVGWSVWADECTWLTADALRNAVEQAGVPAIFYVDNGAGFKNKALCDKATGLLSKLQITVKHSLPYNSQARGMIERFHKSAWIRAARTLPAYVGGDMDPQARQLAFKIGRKDIKEYGNSPVYMEWNEFIDWCYGVARDYNNRPHTSLPKYRDEAGKIVHQSPNMAYEIAVNQGFKPDMLTKQESRVLFRPQITRTIKRGEIQLFGKYYFSLELEDYHNELVKVDYDIHDPQYVWVRNMKGSLVAIAEIDANKSDHFDLSVIEQARQKRAQGRLKRLQIKADNAQAELGTNNTPQITAHDSVDLEAERKVLEKIEARKQEPEPRILNGRPLFTDDQQYINWCLENESQLTAQDTKNLKEKLNSKTSRMLLEAYGIDLDALESLVKSLAA